MLFMSQTKRRNMYTVYVQCYPHPLIEQHLQTASLRLEFAQTQS